MRILIMGAGLAGVTAAFELLEDGHDITVIDRQPGPARETSFANAGLVAPGHAFAWGSPKAPKILLKSLFQADQPLRYRFRVDPAMWRWSLKFLCECTAEKARINTARKHRLCRYSQLALQDVVARTGVVYDGERKGLLYLYRKQESFDQGVSNMQILMDAGQDLEVIDRERAAEIDPALEPTKERIAGGLHGRTDESGDSQKFTEALAALCAARDVRFRYETTVTGIATDGDRIDEVRTDKGAIKADLYIMALGAFSPIIAKSLPETVSVYPVKGYSATLPIDGANNPPTVGGIDEDNLFAYVRMGDRLRLTAVAEFAGYDTSHRPSDFFVHAESRKRTSSQRRRLPAPELLGLPSPDDAGGHADPRPRPPGKPLLQHRPRPYGLDHGLRHRAHHRRPDRRPHPGSAHGRFEAPLGV